MKPVSTSANARIYVKIVADLFHPGHVRFLKAARTIGGHLTVCVVPDERVAVAKNRHPILSLAERAEIVAACRYVDQVITDGPKVTTLDFMRENGFDLYVFGARDAAELSERRADCRELPNNMIMQIDYTTGISTTEIIARIAASLE
ncbi:MAG: adenylyltransferase/cytidyltransferase family protein [Candidatus Competibacteraceae bacterium]|nr:adenylyltransferase/cytidyltransferase family protein [Candidatus Competibacteraceae bacterium]